MFREAKGKLGPLISDNGNAIMDVHFGAIKDAAKLAQEIKMIPGIVETGLFIDLTDIVYLGSETQVKR